MPRHVRLVHEIDRDLGRVGRPSRGRIVADAQRDAGHAGQFQCVAARDLETGLTHQRHQGAGVKAVGSLDLAGE